MRAARAWLAAHDVAHTFHDYRKQGVDAEMLERWADRIGWERLLNRAGTTFRKLPEPMRVSIDRAAAIALMRAQPAMIKRPVAERGDTLIVGFTPDVYQAAFSG